MKYSEKLRHPNWQRKRLEILERDGFKCVTCGCENKQLHVHHKTYEYGREPWDYTNNNFSTLCNDCHEWEEYYKSEFNGLVQYLLHNGLFYKDLLMTLDKISING